MRKTNRLFQSFAHLQLVFRKENKRAGKKEYEGKKYSVFKKDLAEAVIEGLSPIQKKIQKIVHQPRLYQKYFAAKAPGRKVIASQTMAEVRSKIGFLEL